MPSLTTAQAARRLKVTIRRVQAMIKSGRLPAKKFGRAYVVDERDLILVADRKPGNPNWTKAAP